MRTPMNPYKQVGISLIVIGTIAFLTYLLFRYPTQVGPIFVTALVATLITFLLLLILRHFLLVWFSYLEQRDLAEEDPHEVYPFVSIIVPAYNEEDVIEASLASLLELRYPYY